MEISIIGLPKCGKTTIFNALTGGTADTRAYSYSPLNPNIGIAKVPDQRLETLAHIFKPKKITPAEIKYVDICDLSQNFKKDEIIHGQYLNFLNNADSLLHIVRAFYSDSTLSGERDADPVRDLLSLDLELIVSDINIIERRLERIEINLKGARAGERDHHLHEQSLLLRIKSGLQQEVPIWKQSLTDDEIQSLSSYQFLTAKPVLIIINIGEDRIGQTASIETEIRSLYAYPQFDIVTLCGKLEMELAQLSNEEAETFRSTYGLSKPALDTIISTSFRLLGLISFFTTVSDELKAWTVPSGTNALKAAGKIHSDIEKGFIRAEVINHKDLEICGSIAEGRKRGMLKIEGKHYTVRDGDIITFLFNI